MMYTLHLSSIAGKALSLSVLMILIGLFGWKETLARILHVGDSVGSINFRVLTGFLKYSELSFLVAYCISNLKVCLLLS